MNPTGSNLETRRLAVRQRALGNLVLILLTEAGRSGGRLAVQALARDAVSLHYRDVWTLVRRDRGFAVESRDIMLLLFCPPFWPLAREAALIPLVLEPDDFAHSNSDGRRLCVDLAGVEPERLPELLYDNVRLARRRLDDGLDAMAAGFLRAHPEIMPTDPRPLFASPEETP
jgi:hypothetical protein